MILVTKENLKIKNDDSKITIELMNALIIYFFHCLLVVNKTTVTYVVYYDYYIS